ncbi:hypothetical protein BGX27_007518, partial [Mortierella sp. AM989]
MSGPGLVTLPIVAQSAGWLPTILGFMLVGMLSALSSLFICEAMTEVPGNEYFQSNVEFSNLVLCFFGRRYHLLVQVICFLAMQTTTIASIAVSAQLFDNLLIKIFHRTCGIQVYPTASLICVSQQLPSASPFTGVMIMTTGVILSLSMILPLGLLKLSENIWMQLASFILIILIVLQWIVTFCTHGLETTLVPAVGSDISQTFGTILFNYAFITTVPSWANAKQPSVSIHKTITWGVGITTTIYITIAILGGMAYQIPSNSSLIQAISSSPDATVLSQIGGYTFPIAALITSIPINTIVIRYNLIQSGACNMLWANIFSGLLPWLVAIPCMTGSGLTTVINWSSLILVSAANFIIPFILYIYSKRHREKLNKLPVIEMEQQARLSRELSRSSFSGHSRRNPSISGSIRRRLTGSIIHPRSQSRPELAIGSHTGFAAATIIPITVDIGSSSVVQHGSEEGLAGEAKLEHVSGPYFSFSRDGELLEREPPTTNNIDMSGSRMQSSPNIPFRCSTVILHDPGTETGQRKAPLPQRFSHKDKILSMISEKHKRVLEQQAKRQQDEQNGMPAPPMILLSQSSAPEAEDDLSSVTKFGIYTHRNDSYESETCSEMDDIPQTKEITEINSNISTIKKPNRRGSITLSHNQDHIKLNPSPSSPPPCLSITIPELRDIGDARSSASRGNKTENTLEIPSALSPPRPPSSSHKSVIRWSPLNSPRRSSSMGNYEGTSELPAMDLAWLKLKSDLAIGGTAAGLNFQLPHAPNFLDSAASIPSLDRRVSSTDEQRRLTPSPDLERRPSFSSESRRVFKAVVASFTGGSPTRLKSNPSSSSSPNYDAGDEIFASNEYKTILLEDHLEVDEVEMEKDGREGDEREKMATHFSEDNNLKVHPHPSTRGNGDRRDSLGRMAAAFVSQPGSFSIKTSTLSLPKSSRKSDGILPSLSSRHEPGQQSCETSLQSFHSLSPSVPPTFQLNQGSSGRNRTVSASATFQDGRDITRNHNPRPLSTHSLKESVQRNRLTVPESPSRMIIHLSPPPPLHTQRTAASLFIPTSSAPPSPQRLPLKHRTSAGGHSIRMSGSGKTLVAPFQGGNNYSLPGFGSGHSPVSPSNSSPSPGYFAQDQLMSAQSFGSSWLNRRSQSRDPSRSSIGVPRLDSSVPPSPHPPMLDAGSVGIRTDDQSRQEAPVTPQYEASETSDFEKPLNHIQEPQHALENGAMFDATWSLRAIPNWIPVSSLKIAWGSLGILAVAISTTIA